VTYALGDIGPGGGLVFYISGSGLRYEMAPKTWSGSSSDDTPTLNWCNDFSTSVPGAEGTAIGTGSANTTAMDAACTSGAGQTSADYAGGAKTDWFLPSLLELNQMYLYSRVAGFNAATYGFKSTTYGGSFYWTSSQLGVPWAGYQNFFDGSNHYYDARSLLHHVRPIRTF
jgi:hypothetical protein